MPPPCRLHCSAPNPNADSTAQCSSGSEVCRGGVQGECSRRSGRGRAEEKRREKSVHAGSKDDFSLLLFSSLLTFCRAALQQQLRTHSTRLLCLRAFAVCDRARVRARRKQSKAQQQQSSIIRLRSCIFLSTRPSPPHQSRFALARASALSACVCAWAASSVCKRCSAVQCSVRQRESS